jgi:hypothetical protein
MSPYNKRVKLAIPLGPCCTMLALLALVLYIIFIFDQIVNFSITVFFGHRVTGVTRLALLTHAVSGGV